MGSYEVAKPVNVCIGTAEESRPGFDSDSCNSEHGQVAPRLSHLFWTLSMPRLNGTLDE